MQLATRKNAVVVDRPQEFFPSHLAYGSLDSDAGGSDLRCAVLSARRSFPATDTATDNRIPRQQLEASRPAKLRLLVLRARKGVLPRELKPVDSTFPLLSFVGGSSRRQGEEGETRCRVPAKGAAHGEPVWKARACQVAGGAGLFRAAVVERERCGAERGVLRCCHRKGALRARCRRAAGALRARCGRAAGALRARCGRAAGALRALRARCWRATATVPIYGLPTWRLHLSPWPGVAAGLGRGGVRAWGGSELADTCALPSQPRC